MIDPFGRKIEYMRVSVTDRCDLRCRYCMPKGINRLPSADILTFEEIAEVCAAAASLGIKYIRLTGGEPLARLGIEKLAAMIKNIDGIERLTMTTNGVTLERKLPELIAAGLDGVNISLDTLDRDMYKSITGFDCLEAVLKSIDAACEMGIKVKINAVVLKETLGGVMDIVSLARDRNIDVRFIEMMPIGEGAAFESISCDRVMEIIKDSYPNIKSTETSDGRGPARYYHIDGFAGNIGFIDAVHNSFCKSCNRIRLTSTGFLKPCLCYGDGVDLRDKFRNGSSAEVKAAIEKAVAMKPEGHCFADKGSVSERRDMFRIGG